MRALAEVGSRDVLCSLRKTARGIIVPIVRIWIAVFPNTFREMVIDILHTGEARAAYDTEELALCSLGFLWLFHAFSKDSAVFGLADPPHFSRVGVTTVTAWHLLSRSVKAIIVKELTKILKDRCCICLRT